ncbi:MAG: uroporphyrinogen-III C-methyltransferase [Deltaproteobacteria bacterium]|nr:uroporphyrinogen-III C-methyltransferase [Deltaproteobacteria bacterium]
MGKVYIGGAGPGDTGLVTYKCLEIIKKADVIIYDFLANKDLLLYAKKEAETIYVGKKGSCHEMEQEEINELILRKAKEHRIVLRLKGGDPFIFGRGGEEAEFLRKNGVPYEIIPGVTSAISAPAYAGIPLTYRNISSVVVFVTGHEAQGKETSSIDWKTLATFKGTLVFLMGMKNLSSIKENLLREGKDPATRVCVIQWGTMPKQKVLVSTLQNVEEDVKTASMGPPAVIVIGDVIELREKLLWFENLPLFGKKIVVTRPYEQSFEIAEMLKEKGADVSILPTIKIVPIIPNESLDRAIESIDSYYGVIFTSQNGARIFFERLFEKGFDSRNLHGVKVFAIGPSTAKEVRSYGIKAEFIPEKFLSEGIVEVLSGMELKGKRFLLPRAYKARDTIPRFIESYGGKCEIVALYKTEIPEKKEKIEEEPDMVVFTSSSTVKNFLQMYGSDILHRTNVASIGPVTSKTLTDLKIKVSVEAKRHDIKGLVEAIEEFFCETCS